MKILSTLANSFLLEEYGYEPYEGQTVASRWKELTNPWHKGNSRELSHLRQIMLTIHYDLCPDDESRVYR